MKIKAGWVAFVPIMVGTLFLHLYYTFFVGGEEIAQKLYGDYYLLLNGRTEPEMIVMLAGVLFVITLIMFLCDRKTAPVCDFSFSPLSGITLALGGLVLGVNSSVSLVDAFSNGAVCSAAAMMDLLAVLTALLFAMVGMGMLIGYNMAKHVRLVMILPTLWGVIQLLNAFISHRKETPSFAFFDVFVWVFLTLFIFNFSMVLCGINIKNPVKSSFLYGFMTVLFGTVYTLTGVHQSMADVGHFDFMLLIPQLTVAALSLFTLCFMFSLSGKMTTKSKAFADADIDEDDDDNWKMVEEEEDVPEAAFGVGSTKYVTEEFEKIRLEKAAQKAKERTGSIPIVSAETARDEHEEEAEEPLSTLDRIDQLIMELSEDDHGKK